MVCSYEAKQSFVLCHRDPVSQVLCVLWSLPPDFCWIPDFLYSRENQLSLYKLLQYSTLQWAKAKEEGKFWHDAQGWCINNHTVL